MQHWAPSPPVAKVIGARKIATSTFPTSKYDQLQKNLSTFGNTTWFGHALLSDWNIGFVDKRWEKYWWGCQPLNFTCTKVRMFVDQKQSGGRVSANLICNKPFKVTQLGHARMCETNIRKNKIPFCEKSLSRAVLFVT